MGSSKKKKALYWANELLKLQLFEINTFNIQLFFCADLIMKLVFDCVKSNLKNQTLITKQKDELPLNKKSVWLSKTQNSLTSMLS